jgi:hypothetical protein
MALLLACDLPKNRSQKSFSRRKGEKICPNLPKNACFSSKINRNSEGCNKYSFDFNSTRIRYRSSKAAPTAWTPSLFFVAMDARGRGEEHAVDPWWWGEAAFGFGLATGPMEISSAQENEHRCSEAGAALGSSSMVVAG